MEPYEIVAAPYTLYLAPVGEAYPVIDAAPAGNWVKLGTAGDLNYDEEGVTVAHPQELSQWRALGSTGPRKAFRTSEGLEVRLTLVDMSLEHYAVALNHNAVATTSAGSGTAGFKELPTYRGLTVVTRALLVRGVSPYDESMTRQYEVPVVYEGASPEPVATKDNPAALALMFVALEDPNAASVADRFGRIVDMNAAALP